MLRLYKYCIPLVAAFQLNTATAQNAKLVLHYDFEGVTGTTVPNQTATQADAQLKNQATIEKMGKYHVLSLGNGTGYLDMTQSAGTPFKDLGDFTVSVYYRVDGSASLSGAGYFLWCFSQSPANTADDAPYSGYRLNAQRFATSIGGFAHETGMEVGAESAKDTWMHVLYRQKGTNGELFINGTRRATYAQMSIPKDAFTTTPAYNWIGRAPFATDAYLTQTLVSDFRVYDGAVTDETITALSARTDTLDYEYMYGEPGDFTKLKAALDECREFISTASTADYPVNALAELEDEVTLKQIVCDQGLLSQTIIDSYTTTLRDKLADVRKMQGQALAPASPASGTDHGFVHPGGLHTQEDFDRIKQLLADGDPHITAAYNALKNGEYAQSTIATWPVETIIRGGSTGQNYMNVARGAAMAYQNALVYKIGGDKAHADAAVRILMAWARGNKYVGGDTNKSLASGIYGYQLANAAELVRDYEGWSREDFEEFKQYILKTWYPVTIDFLRRRHDTWANWRNNSGQRPGHYWSNWGLCNTLAIMSYGILLDDVHMYNQGVSFYKYDHVGNWPGAEALHNRTSEIQNWGLTEFIGNLVPVTHDDNRGPFGQLGQMQETGRDAGHEQMALGLAVDICQVGLNQGDDLFAYMDNRLAAGIEYIAGRNFGGASNLPWTTYRYCDCRTAWHNGWVMGGASGIHGEMRPYWDRILGYYEGTRGVKMPYAEKAAVALRGTGGYDMGGHSYGENSGGYDHLGFSTLTCYRPEMADPATVPVILDGQIEYGGKTLALNTLGGLKYTFEANGTTAIPADGASIRLIPVLPEGTTDNGSWKWNTGETTKDITVKADHSYVYRVSYTCDNGAVAQKMFSIAVAGDCSDEPIDPEITVDGIIYKDTVMQVRYGKQVILYAGSYTGWGSYQWDNGVKGSIVVVPNITSSRTYTCNYTNQGGHVTATRFHLEVVPTDAYISIGKKRALATTAIASEGDSITLELDIPSIVKADEIVWSDGTKGTKLIIPALQTSEEITASVPFGNEMKEVHFKVFATAATDSLYDNGDYYIQDIASQRYLTNTGNDDIPSFLTYDTDNTDTQTWTLDQGGKPTYRLKSKADGNALSRTGELKKVGTRVFRTKAAVGTDRISIYSTGTTEGYWATRADGTVDFTTATSIQGFPYRLIKAADITAIKAIGTEDGKAILHVDYLSTDGRRTATLQPGINIIRYVYTDGTTQTRKVMIR